MENVIDTVASAVAAILVRVGGDRPIAYREWWIAGYDDDECRSGSYRSRWVFTTLGEVCKIFFSRRDLLAYADEIQTMDNVREWWKNATDNELGGASRLMSPEDAKIAQTDEQRKNLEATAAGFAAICGYKVGTREYILAARRAIEGVCYQRERWNDSETRMEEAAACRYAGASMDTYYDDLNFENSRFDARLDLMGEVLEWLEENCPLLMRQMEE